MKAIGGIMAYISDFGIKRAAQILALGALAMNATLAASPTPGTLDIAITGLRNLKGNILICVTANASAFPDCSKDPESKKAVVAANASAHVFFKGIKEGVYAVSLVHDENANGKLDTKAMIPGEGFGFSRNPAILFGPPSFKSARFTVDAQGSVQAIKMKYML
jgi:uncharacterized protein (DUF2141 family)